MVIFYYRWSLCYGRVVQRDCPSSHLFWWFKVSLDLFDFEVSLLQFAELWVLYFVLQETYLGWTNNAGLCNLLFADTVGIASLIFVSDTGTRSMQLGVVTLQL